MTMTDYVYDIETYPNCFTATFYNRETQGVKVFEMSDRKNDFTRFRKFLRFLANNKHRTVGFNNWFFDYPVVHHFYNKAHPVMSGAEVAFSLYRKAVEIIETPIDQRWNNTVPKYEHLVPQIDLLRVHHFDNKARMTSLKVLEFNMQSESIQELPFEPGTHLTDEQIDRLIKYNIHDVEQTAKFYEISMPQIQFREEMSAKYGIDFLNHNDTKIGKDLFIKRLQDAGVACFDPLTKKPLQSKIDQIDLNEIIFDYIQFDRPEFNAVLDWLKARKIKSTKAVFTEIPPAKISTDLRQFCDMSGPKGTVKNLNCIVDGFRFDFGTGGIHGSIESAIVESDDEFCIIDVDVTSLYPSIAIVNDVYPRHLGEKFCEIYADLKKERVSHPKGSVENMALKLALNGVYGDSNNQYSPFYDPQYTMTITINGQLMLCMLAEQVMKIPGLEMIQINTDGITMRLPRDEMPWLKSVMRDWENLTNLDLEQVEYSKMAIRDVNNYSAVSTSGKIKRKGAYEYDVGWHQNHSALVVPKAAEAALIHGKDIAEFVRNHDDDYDFMLRTKVPRNSRLHYESEFGLESDVSQNVSRYYIATEGRYLVKYMPPLKGTKERRIGINKDEYVQVCNNSLKLNRQKLNYQWYISEVEKLVQPLQSKPHG